MQIGSSVIFVRIRHKCAQIFYFPKAQEYDILIKMSNTQRRYEMDKFKIKIPIGLRTVKTAIAVIIAILVVEFLGTTDSKLIFAMLGAMAAVQPTFKESVEAFLSQIIGVIFGAVAGIVLLALRMPPLVTIGVGIILVITLYNVLRIRYSPSLPCFILVMLCTTPDTQPMMYALGRIWDTAIGLSIGMLVNMLIFPYDNSRQIRSTAESLDVTLLAFLEDMFDGDEFLPDVKEMTLSIDRMAHQLNTFSAQKLPTRLRRQKEELEKYRLCEQKARKLLAHMEVLSSVASVGRLTKENYDRLADCGADIKDTRIAPTVTDIDTVTNYHLSQILNLRQELLDALNH